MDGDVIRQDFAGYTLLHRAEKEGHPKVAKLLRDNIEGDENPKTVDGQTPLHIACRYGDYDCVKTLLDCVEPNPKDDFGNTPLHSAARNGRSEIVELLYKFIKDPEDRNPRNYEGKTPSDLAKLHEKYVEICFSDEPVDPEILNSSIFDEV